MYFPASTDDTCILGYLKDSNAAAHSVESDIFYAVIHVQLYS